jgi:hypothetical protein
VRAEELLALLRAAPFRPFRVILNSGKTYEVKHPEFVKVGRSSWSYYYMDQPDAPYDRFDIVSLLLIKRIEYIESPTKV